MVDNRKSGVRALGYLLRICSFLVSKADVEKWCEVVKKDAGRRETHRVANTLNKKEPNTGYSEPAALAALLASQRSTIRPHHRDVLNHDAQETLEV
jgi:hypothetical protein